MRSRVWPVELPGRLMDGGRLVLRPLERSDRAEFLELRQRNRDWLRPWDPTNPHGPTPTLSFAQALRKQRKQAAQGSLLPFVATVDGALAGQVNLSNVTLGAFYSCTVGYWVGQEFAGRGVAPMMVAMAGDYAISAVRLHRIEINIRPENAASLAVVRKLGLRDEGLRPRYLHIDGAWRDHRSFAVTTEEIGPGGLVGRLLAGATENGPTEG